MPSTCSPRVLSKRIFSESETIRLKASSLWRTSGPVRQGGESETKTVVSRRIFKAIFSHRPSELNGRFSAFHMQESKEKKRLYYIMLGEWWCSSSFIWKVKVRGRCWGWKSVFFLHNPRQRAHQDFLLYCKKKRVLRFSHRKKSNLMLNA